MFFRSNFPLNFDAQLLFMQELSIWSIFPPVIAIILAIATRQVFVSLLFGIYVGYLILSGGNPIDGFFNTIDAIVAIFQDAGNTRTIIFSCLVGVLILLIQKSGGVKGFVLFLERQLQQREGKQSVIFIQFLAWLIGLSLFVESNISSLTVGTLFRPLFDKHKISREKLAYIADSSSAPSCILIPFNAWGAFIMSLLVAQGYSNPFQVMVQSIVYNFYPIIALIFVLIVIFFRKDMWAMKKAEQRVKSTGKFLWEHSTPMVADELTAVQPTEKVPPRVMNMILPLLTMVVMMPVMLVKTGWQTAIEQMSSEPIGQQMLFAIGQGSGSTSVLVAVLIAIFVSILLYALQGIFSLKEFVDLSLKGMSEMLPIALILLLAFTISGVCKELQTGQYIASVAKDAFSPRFVPFVVFITSGVIAFSTGTSWGTFGIMISIAIPMAQQMGANELLTIAAVLGGGVFGDHCSPISDTTIVSSMAAATDHIDHVRTQLPYALLGGSLAALLYLCIGIFG